MEKNVGSVNLEELKAAREALDRERGVETDPNMYNNYDPEKHKAEREKALSGDNSLSDAESSTTENEEIISEIENNNDEEELLIDDSDSSYAENTDLASDNNEIKVENNFEEIDSKETELEEKKDDEKINFNLYDSFSDFEVKNESVDDIENDTVENEKDDSKQVDLSENIEEKKEDSDVESSLDNFLSELDSILSKGSDDDSDELLAEENQEESKEDENEEIKVEEESLNNAISDEKETLDIVSEPVEIENKDESDSEKPEIKEDNFDFLDKNNQLEEDKKEENQTETYDTEVLTDFSKISEMFDEMQDDDLISDDEPATETTEEKAEEIVVENGDSSEEDESVDVGGYEKIEAYNFVDVMSSEEFKEVDNLSYLLGKDSEGKFVYGNLSDTCGTVIFTKNEDSIKSNFNSMILSLILKNNPRTMQFVICDPMFNSEFDVYKKSSYMYFNRVAKNNREIVDSMFELSKELEKRYNDLVYAGVKSISAYNMQAEDRNSEPMPYIVLFINNYAKMMQFLDAEKINTCLYNILKFGRIVGVYAIIASTSDIEKNEINYNLPTRICYKTEDEYDSVASIGSGGAERLKDEQDFLYSTVYDDEVKHLKCATLSLKEIEVIIENLEN